VLNFAAAPAFATDTVEQWDVYEIEMKTIDGNPFLDVRFSAVSTTARAH